MQYPISLFYQITMQELHLPLHFPQLGRIGIYRSLYVILSEAAEGGEVEESSHYDLHLQ